MDNASAIAQLDSVRYLYFRELSEPKDNSLRLVVEEAVVNATGVVNSELPELDAVPKNAAPIESVEGCAIFELYWTLRSLFGHRRTGWLQRQRWLRRRVRTQANFYGSIAIHTS